MTEPVLPDETRLVSLFRALEDRGVEYAVFGAIALGLHGLARATADLGLFIAAEKANVERLKAALRSVFEDPAIEEISADDLCGDYPAVRYEPPEGFGLDSTSRRTEIPVRRFGSVEEMPPPWKDAEDPSNLRAVAGMLDFYRRLRPREVAARGTVHRYRSVSEARAADSDAFR